MSESKVVQTTKDQPHSNTQNNAQNNQSGINQTTDLDSNGANPKDENKETNGTEPHINEHNPDDPVEVVQLRSPGKPLKELLQEPRRRSGSYLLDFFKRKSSDDLKPQMKPTGSVSHDSPMKLARSPSLSITVFNKEDNLNKEDHRLSRSLPTQRRQSIAVPPSAQLQQKIKKEMKKEKKKKGKEQNNDNNNNSAATVTSSSSSDDEDINTDSGGGFKRFFKGLLKGDLSLRLQGLQEDQASGIIGVPNSQILNVTKYEELPKDLRKIVKASKIPKELVKKNFDILLNILAFQTKGLSFYTFANKIVKFQRVEDKKREAITMEKPAVPPPRSLERPNLELESLLMEGDPRDLYKIMREEGKGGFGKVFKGVSKATGEKFAIKVMQHSGEKDRRFNIGEFGFLRFCDHPNIVKYYSCYEHGNELWGVMEYLEGGTLEQAVKAYTFAENQISYVAREVLRALAFLHSENLVHRDLKSGNIMLSTQGEIKIIDFGLCVDISNGMKTSMVGSPFWMPPEMIQRKPYDHKVDLWSLGICLMELANGNPPHAKSSIKAMFTVGTEGYPQPFEKPKQWSEEFKEFLNLCLQMDPQNRPTSAELLQHSFMKKADSVKSMKNIISIIFILSTMPF